MHCTLSPFLSFFFTLSVCLSLSLSVCRWHFKLEGKLWLDLWRCLSLLSTINVYRTVRISVSVKHILPLLLLCFMFLYLFALHVLLSLSFTHFSFSVFTGRQLTETFFLESPNRPSSHIACPGNKRVSEARKWKIYECPFHSHALSLSLSISVAECAWISVTFDGIKQTVNWLEEPND